MKKHIIQFYVYRGEKYYVAEGIDLAIVTQAETLDALIKNIQEAIELHLEGEHLDDLNLSPQPTALINFELPLIRAYA